jgi:hypothetical protein
VERQGELLSGMGIVVAGVVVCSQIDKGGMGEVTVGRTNRPCPWVFVFYLFLFLTFLVGLGFELRILSLQNRHAST